MANALTYKGGAANYQYGIASAEVGMNCQSFEGDYKPEVDEYMIGISGWPIGFVVAGCQGDFTMEGQILAAASTGIMAATFIGSAFVPGNTVSYFGQAGGLYLKGGTVRSTYNGWLDVSAKLRSNVSIS